MYKIPEEIKSEEELDDLLSRPYQETVELFSRSDGDILFLGIAGKIGPSIALMAKRACKEAGVKKSIYGVSRFSSEVQQKNIEKNGIITIKGDLLDSAFVQNLPDAKNVFFLAGMKFGAVENPGLTWAMNSYVPGLIAQKFSESRIVAYSTGCVYPLTDAKSGGSTETDQPEPVGEYAQSCLGRERIFEYNSLNYNTPVVLIRLNYAVEMRYGVLVDIANKVKNEKPIDLSMGYFNIIWQGDANNFVLQSLEYVETPPRILNITGEEILAVRDVATEFGKFFGKKPVFTGKESDTALLSNAQQALQLFGKPKVGIPEIIKWTAEWINNEGKQWGKPTHFEVRDGKY